MSETVLILGKKYNVCDIVESYGFNFILIDPECEESLNTIQIPESVSLQRAYDYSLFDRLFKDNKIVAILVCLEDFVELGAQLRERYGVFGWGPNSDQAKLYRDKVLMKKLAVSAGIRSAPFMELKERPSYLDLVSVVGADFIIKPRNGWLAQRITRIQSENDYLRYLKSTPDIEGYFAETYISNLREYCCDTLLADNQVLCQFSGEYSVSCLESNNKHEGLGVSFPGFLDDTHLNELKQLTQKFIRASGVRDGFFHVEFLWDGKAWNFGEVGCRLPGGYQLPSESHIVGESLLEFYVKIFIPSLRPKSFHLFDFKNKYTGYYLYPKKVGKIKEIKVDNKGMLQEFIKELKIYVKPGDVLKHEDSSVTMAAHVLYSAEDLQTFKELTKNIKSLVTIEYE